MKRIARFTLWGAVGFGLGGVIGGIVAVDAATFLGFAIMGGIGGMSLGLAMKSWKMAVFLAIAGALGLSIGTFVAVLIGLGLGEAVQLPALFWMIMGRFTIAGAIGGLVLGLPLNSWKAVGFLTLAGAVAFRLMERVQEVVNFGLITPQLFSRTAQMAIWGVISGALLGVTLGYLEKGRGQE